MNDTISHKGMKALTETERKVAKLVASGYTEEEIASKLFVTRDTVHSHTYRIRKKIGAKSAVDICRKYILDLENPKKFFIALACLVIQTIISLQPEAELRKPVRTGTRIVRVTRSKRKIIY